VSPDVIYTVNTPLPWLVITRRPRVGIFHHIAIDSFFETHPFPQNLLGYVSQWVGVLRERNNPTVSVSPSTSRELVSRGHKPQNVHEIRNGLDLGTYSPGETSPVPRILYVGGLDRYKGVDRIPGIHQSLSEIFDSTVHLDVAGRDGPVKEEIKTYCAQTESAHFHGFVSMEKKINLLQSAWVFIAPSRVEGWGIAVLEANACGTPAVGSDVNGLRDSIRDGESGLLVDGSNPTEFAACINDLLSNTQKRETFEANARSWAEQHSWEQTVDQLEELFISVSSRTE
jgi:glycosyltransferase involved in cell wall biosynthesis